MRTISKLLSIVLFCLGLALPTVYTSGALAQNFIATCKNDDALIGAAATVYATFNRGTPLAPVMTPVYVNLIAVRCAPLDGGKLGAPYTMDSIIQFPVPTTQTNGTDAKICGSGKLVTTLQGATGAEGAVGDFRFGCSDPGAGGQLRFTQGPKDFDFESRCDKGEYAHGITATPSNNVGFTEFAIDCVAMNTDEDQADNGDQVVDPADFLFGNLHFQIVVNGTTLTFGKKGKVRIVDAATTLFKNKGKDDLDYLDTGDKVIVVACEDKGKGWCAVVKPQVGYVWGGDLK